MLEKVEEKILIDAATKAAVPEGISKKEAKAEIVCGEEVRLKTELGEMKSRSPTTPIAKIRSSKIHLSEFSGRLHQ
ncbi:unnamed protein product [Linum trigynum]|uniref:Uncharacterized protein n=1 Tax=Linum trigynum TaxID=586398 RepID=A0AAV2ES05_9ROSI